MQHMPRAQSSNTDTAADGRVENCTNGGDPQDAFTRIARGGGSVCTPGHIGAAASRACAHARMSLSLSLSLGACTHASV